MEREEQNKVFVRWQAISLKQLSYAINLILVLSVGSLGFETALLTNTGMVLESCWQRQAFLVSLIMLTFAVLFGIFATVSRLCDFRITKDIARKNLTPGANILWLEHARCRAKVLGK